MGNQDLYIRIKSERIRFPTICPVCSRPTSDEAMIAGVSTNQKIAASQMKPWDFLYQSRSAYSRQLLREGMDIRRLLVPVCQDHVISSLDRGRIRAIFGLLAGFSILAFIWHSVFIGFLLYDGLSVAPSSWALFLFFGFLVIISIRILGPSAIDRAFKVIDTAFGGEFMLIRLKNRDYADEMIRLNPMTAKELKKKKK